MTVRPSVRLSGSPIQRSGLAGLEHRTLPGPGGGEGDLRGQLVAVGVGGERAGDAARPRPRRRSARARRAPPRSARGPPAGASGARRRGDARPRPGRRCRRRRRSRARARARSARAGRAGVSRTGSTSGAVVAEGAQAVALEDRRARPFVGAPRRGSSSPTSRSAAGCRRRRAPASRCASRARGGSRPPRPGCRPAARQPSSRSTSATAAGGADWAGPAAAAATARARRRGRGAWAIRAASGRTIAPKSVGDDTVTKRRGRRRASPPARLSSRGNRPIFGHGIDASAPASSTASC